ncbi:MAG TPA: NAD(P)H-dependent oxidoreductase [Steroidobacteraceae bacterium]|jgi:chromate reductase, NAD(P)H dehydrogenase (quinone)|nr:NAD(P)H-dependent oxidoreductase [Steroidobacteraceae bacterium]
MQAQFDVVVLVGSLRKASYTRKLANVLMHMAPPSLRCRLVEIGGLPLYNQDLDITPPNEWVDFRREVAKAHAVLILTPEYNRSVPGCLKNALDVGSRPPQKNAWNGKPAAIVSVTPGKLGAFGANHAVRQSLVFLNMPAMQQPEAYISGAGDLFDETGKLKSDDVKGFLAKFMTAFEQWTTKLVAPAPSSHSG